MLLIVGTLNVIYGIGAIDNANWWAGDTRIVISDLSAVGWILIILGIVQITGGFSLMAGNAYGRVIGIIGAGVGAFWALLSIGAGHWFWSLAIFALCIYVLAGIVEFGEDEREGRAV
jgi:vacuolar-type H+-ATPase subunit I/STV1